MTTLSDSGWNAGTYYAVRIADAEGRMRWLEVDYEPHAFEENGHTITIPRCTIRCHGGWWNRTLFTSRAEAMVEVWHERAELSPDPSRPDAERVRLVRVRRRSKDT